ncbi:MAG: DUF711 family protein [Streptococcus sp.]
MNLEKLEAMTAICSVGLDMIAIPADTPDTTIAAMIADEAAIGVINQKTTAVRIIPYGKEGDMLELGGLLGYAPVMKVNKASSADFIARGGQIQLLFTALKTKRMINALPIGKAFSDGLAG